jgi:xylitol oxidase
MVRNWAGNVDFRAPRRAEPETLNEVRRLVAAETSVHALGTGHSFNTAADSRGLQLSTARLTGEIFIDEETATVEVPAGMRYGELAVALAARGWALGNLASLPHISVAGSIATGTHGSGDHNPSLAAAVCALEIVVAGGDLLVLRRGDAGFAGAVVALGALGVVTRVTLDIEPRYEIEQTVYEDVSWDALLESPATATGAGYSVSLFTSFGRDDVLDQLWLKRRPDRDRAAPAQLLGARPATRSRHPLPGMPGDTCTQQFGVAGPWHERLPHFRLAFIPSNGAELQSEYLMPRSEAAAVLGVLRALGPRIRPLLQACEVRTVAADDLWLSPAYQQDVIGLHFTWKLDQPAVEALLPELEAALAPFAPRPHWGKLFTQDADALRRLYPRFDDFAELVQRYDPEGVFRNDFLSTRLLGSADRVLARKVS